MTHINSLICRGLEMYREEFRKEVEKVLGGYVPNKVDMDNLVNFMYKIFVSVFKDADMKKEYKNIKGITQLDVDGFKKAVRDISLFTSQMVMIETLNKSYKELKNIVPSVSVDMIAQNMSGVPVQQKKPSQEGNSVVAEAEFDIDIKSIPKVNISKSTIQREKKEDIIPSEFEYGISMDSLDKINKDTQKINVSNNTISGDDFTLGAGFLAEGYNSVPNISIDLDY